MMNFNHNNIDVAEVKSRKKKKKRYFYSLVLF